VIDGHITRVTATSGAILLVVPVLLFVAMAFCVVAFVLIRRRERRLLEKVQRLSSLLMASNQELEFRSLEVKRANQRQGRLFAWITHELRTPVTVILGFCEVALLNQSGAMEEGQQKSYLVKIQSAGKHLLRIINDVLDVSKLDAGELRCVIAPVNLKESVEQIFVSVKPLAEAQNVRLEHSVPAGLRVLADAQRLSQVFYNLVGNALSFTPPGGLVSIQANASDELIEIRVTDTGTGMTAEDQNVIFEEFRQASKNHSPAKGTGLGLTITKHLVERQGGRIWVESEVGKGSSFIFTLPDAATVLEPEIYEPEPAADQIEAPDPSAETKKARGAAAGRVSGEHRL
jgi:signal transduction histidine kinase